MFSLSAGMKIKMETLISFVKRLHGNECPKRLKAHFKAWLKYISPSELAFLEGHLISNRLPQAGVIKVAMLHLDVLQESF